MRQRLVAAFVGLTVAVVVLYGVPRAYFLADLVRSQEQTRVDRTADLVATVIDERTDAGQPVDAALLDALAESGESIVVRPAAGPPVRSAGAEEAGDVSAEAALSGGGSVVVSRDGGSVADEVSTALLPLVLLGLVLVALAAAAGVVLADRFARPFRTLASAARGLGAGDLHPRLPDYRIPEARAIATSLVTSGERLDLLIGHERRLLAQASHELRTPVTALRLALEDLALWPETTPAVAAELHRAVGELDRLAAAVGDLLETSRELSATAEVDVDLEALVAHAVARSGRRVTLERNGRLPVRLDPSPVAAALDLLLVDGTTARVAQQPTHVEVAITGYAALPADLGRAAELVAAAGGQLARGDGEVVVRLPRRRPPGS